MCLRNYATRPIAILHGLTEMRQRVGLDTVRRRENCKLLTYAAAGAV